MTGDDLSSRIVLTPFAPGRDAEFAAMLDEYRAAGETDVYTGLFVKAWEGYAALCELLQGMKAGGYPTPGIMPMDAYFIEADGRMLGEIYIRHRLSPRLELIGGHVGYKVRPSCRNRSVATAALRLALQKLAALGVDQALVTCRDSNDASARVIEKCGGARMEDSFVDGHVERRYLVSTAL
jgi:predicted acetyltransferase